MQHVLQMRAATTTASFSVPTTATSVSAPTLVEFIETSFNPHHIARKRPAGRAHYQAMLKHILKPETVDRLFPPGTSKTRMTSKTHMKSAGNWPYLDDVRLCDLNADHVRHLMSSAQALGYSPQTVSHIRGVINAIISHARKKHVLSGDNPVSQVDLPVMIRKKSYDLTILQAKELLKLMRYPEREITLLTITTGMNIGEICALRWKHVNLSQFAVRFNGKLIPPRSVMIAKEHNIEETERKYARATKSIALPEPLLHALTVLKRWRNVSDSNSFVLATDDGKPLCPANVRASRLKPIGETLGMPRLSWRIIRRAHDTSLTELKNQLACELVMSASSLAWDRQLSY